jgi:thaumarchaeosortase
VPLSWETIKKSWLHISLIGCFGAAIFLLMFLDYFNLEKIAFFNEIGFFFDYTWKGRLFLLLFFWLFVLESFSGLKPVNEQSEFRCRNKLKIFAIFVCALVPLAYVIGINFLGLDQIVIGTGEFLRLDYWKVISIHWANILHGDWPLSLEYVVFTISFLATVLLAFGKKGLKTFSITAAFVGGIGVVYMIDTIFPYGAFKPLQALALPTAAHAAVLLETIGMRFTMFYSPGPTSAPVIIINAQDVSVSTSIAWPCAGVHSIFLFIIIMLLLFHRSSISLFRKTVYFIVGLFGTYLMNVLRIVAYFVLLVGQGRDVALIFHNVYGELLFFSWMLLYIVIIGVIQRYTIVERLKAFLYKSRHRIVFKKT